MADEGPLLRADRRRQRREPAGRRTAASAPPTGPNQVWQSGFSEHETTGGRTRRVAGRSSKPGSGWCWSPAADQHDAAAGVEPAPAEAEAMLDGVTPLDRPTDPGTGETAPITPVTDNGGPFRPFRSGHVITAHPEPGHVRTRVRARARLPVAEA